MTNKTASKGTKIVQVIARYTLKRNGHVIYAVRSSNGVDQYQVLVIGGVVQSCSCPAHSHCYHKRGIQIMEENRKQVATPDSTVPVVEVLAQAQAEMVQFERDTDPNAYEVLAETKKPVRRYTITDPTDAWYGLSDAQIDTAKGYWQMATDPRFA